MTGVFRKVFLFILLVGISACLQDSAAVYGKTPKEVKSFRKIFKAEVIDKLNKYAVDKKETGKEYMLFTPEDLEEGLEIQIRLLFDKYLKYKAALPYKYLKSFMNERKKYFLDGIYMAENLTFQQADAPGRIIFIDVLPGKKIMECYLIRYEKDKSVTQLARYLIEFNFLLTDTGRILFTVTRKGCDINQHLAYERARLYIKADFAAEVFSSWIESMRDEFDNRFIEQLRERLIGMTPPGIDYTPENEAQFFKEGGNWCVWVKGWMRRSDFDRWVREFRGQVK
jgi:hypothetical protein